MKMKNIFGHSFSPQPIKVRDVWHLTKLCKSAEGEMDAKQLSEKMVQAVFKADGKTYSDNQVHRVARELRTEKTLAAINEPRQYESAFRIIESIIFVGWTGLAAFCGTYLSGDIRLGTGKLPDQWDLALFGLIGAYAGGSAIYSGFKLRKTLRIHADVAQQTIRAHENE